MICYIEKRTNSWWGANITFLDILSVTLYITELQSMGSLRVGHDWATSLSHFTFMHWRRKWQPTPVFLPGESQGRQSLVGCRLWCRTESDTTEATYSSSSSSITFMFILKNFFFFLERKKFTTVNSVSRLQAFVALLKRWKVERRKFFL